MLRVQAVLCAIIISSCIYSNDTNYNNINNLMKVPTETTFLKMQLADNTEQRCNTFKAYSQVLQQRAGRHNKDGNVCITTPEECDKLQDGLSVHTYTNYPEIVEQGIITYPETTIYVNRNWLENPIYTPLMLKELNRAFYGDAQQSMTLKRDRSLFPDNPSSTTKDRFISAVFYKYRLGRNPLVHPETTNTYCDQNTSLSPLNVDADIAMTNNIDAPRLMAKWLRWGIAPQPENRGFVSSQTLAQKLEQKAQDEDTCEELYKHPSIIHPGIIVSVLANNNQQSSFS